MATQKKAADVDYSMQEKILALYEIQKIDSKIDEINNLGVVKIRLRSMLAAIEEQKRHKNEKE